MLVNCVNNGLTHKGKSSVCIQLPVLFLQHQWKIKLYLLNAVCSLFKSVQDFSAERQHDVMVKGMPIPNSKPLLEHFLMKFYLIEF